MGNGMKKKTCKKKKLNPFFYLSESPEGTIIEEKYAKQEGKKRRYTKGKFLGKVFNIFYFITS